MTWLAGGAAPSWTTANSLARRPRWKSFTSAKNAPQRLSQWPEFLRSYWEIENRDELKPSADKITRIAAALDVTPDFLFTAAGQTPDDAVTDQATFRKYQGMSDQDMKRLRQIIDAWERDP